MYSSTFCTPADGTYIAYVRYPVKNNDQWNFSFFKNCRQDVFNITVSNRRKKRDHSLVIARFDKVIQFFGRYKLKRYFVFFYLIVQFTHQLAPCTLLEQNFFNFFS